MFQSYNFHLNIKKTINFRMPTFCEYYFCCISSALFFWILPCSVFRFQPHRVQVVRYPQLLWFKLTIFSVLKCLFSVQSCQLICTVPFLCLLWVTVCLFVKPFSFCLVSWLMWNCFWIRIRISFIVMVYTMKL